jgi:hypothetical protein
MKWACEYQKMYGTWYIIKFIQYSPSGNLLVEFLPCKKVLQHFRSVMPELDALAQGMPIYFHEAELEDT